MSDIERRLRHIQATVLLMFVFLFAGLTVHLLRGPLVTARVFAWSGFTAVLLWIGAHPQFRDAYERAATLWRRFRRGGANG